MGDVAWSMSFRRVDMATALKRLTKCAVSCKNKLGVGILERHDFVNFR
jgi:hypothetical protein